jgi:hypothetical protein
LAWAPLFANITMAPTATLIHMVSIRSPTALLRLIHKCQDDVDMLVIHIDILLADNAKVQI